MPNFMFAYHGGSMPETPEEGEKIMAKWGEWMGSLGSALVDGGNPVGMSKTVSGSGIIDDGGANPLSGFSIVSAPNVEDACKLAGGCPIIEAGGTVEVAEIVEM